VLNWLRTGTSRSDSFCISEVLQLSKSNIFPGGLLPEEKGGLIP
jgi:hypothetical protein